MKNDGKKLEINFVNVINGKTYKDLPYGIKGNLKHMYKYLDDGDLIKSELVEGANKADFYIEIKGDRKYISLKTGTATTVGTYGLKNFIAYLRSKGISERTLKIIVYMHFGDGTLDNTGKKRYCFEDFRRGKESLVEAANEELNKSKEFIKDIVHRVVFRGFYEDNVEANYIYHGTEEQGYCCNFRQVCKQIDAKKWSYIRNLHIGPIQFSPVARYADMDVLDDSKRWGVRFFWIGLQNEVERIGRSFRYQYDGYITLAEREANKAKVEGEKKKRKKKASEK
ncbi:MAG: hypothetical protein MJ220_01855 [Bacilli bacterium]|nr:hypothetical protein [Bacilli bacterium]